MKTLLVLPLLVCASLAQTLTMIGPASVYPGQTLPVTISVTGTGTTGLAALEWDNVTPSGVALSLIAPVIPWTAWTDVCNPVNGACMMVDMAALTTLTDGPLATETFTLSQSATAGTYTLPLSSLSGADKQGLSINTIVAGVPYSFIVLSPCSFNGSPANVADVQIMINAALGIGACPVNVTASGRSCNVSSVQQTIVAALGGACLL